MSVLKDFTCRNPDCAHDFESRDAAPICPKCRSMTAWRPSGGHMKSETTSHSDRMLRDVASRYGLNNLRSAKEGEAAHPGLGPPGKRSFGKFMGVEVQERPTAGFADWGGGRLAIPAAGPGKFKNKHRTIPTEVKGVDNRPIKL